MIQLENVSVRYEDTVALHPVSLGIHEGQFTVLLGSSRAGKSTFLRCLNLMHSRISGRVRVSGFDGNWNRKALQKLRRETGMIFQQHQLIERQFQPDDLEELPVFLLTSYRNISRLP